MTDTIPFVTNHVAAVIEGIRLLESFVTAPLGLHSDIKMLRESLPFPEAEGLSREKERERRTAFASLTDAPLDLALHTISSLGVSLDVLEAARGQGGSPLEEAWVAQARRVLTRAESRVSGDMRARLASGVQGLYVVVGPDATNGRPVRAVAEAALRGGARVLQLRDKTSDKGAVLPVALDLKAMCDEHGALFIMNGDADLAIAVRAHGLHVGQSDLPIREVRRVLKPRQMVGRSNNTLQQAMDSQAQEADYISVGAVYSTSTLGKSGLDAVGPELVSEVKERVGQPVVAVGGIDATNAGEVVKAGADCVCVVSAVTSADDPEAAAGRLAEAVERASA